MRLRRTICRAISFLRAYADYILPVLRPAFSPSILPQYLISNITKFSLPRGNTRQMAFRYLL